MRNNKEYMEKVFKDFKLYKKVPKELINKYKDKLGKM